MKLLFLAINKRNGVLKDKKLKFFYLYIINKTMKSTSIFSRSKLPVILDLDEEILKKSGYTSGSQQKPVNLDSDDDLLFKVIEVPLDSDEELLKKSGYTPGSQQNPVNFDSDDDSSNMLSSVNLNSDGDIKKEPEKNIQNMFNKLLFFGSMPFLTAIYLMKMEFNMHRESLEYINTNEDVEKRLLENYPNTFDIVVNRTPVVGDKIITKVSIQKFGYRHPAFSIGTVQVVDAIMETAVIKLDEGISVERGFSFCKFAIIKKRIRPTDEEILKNMPEPYDMIVNRFPVVGDKIITKVESDINTTLLLEDPTLVESYKWLPLSFGEVIHVEIESDSVFIKFESEPIRKFSYKNDEFAVIEEKDKITENIPDPYTKVVKRDPREYDEVITKIQLDNYPPYKVGKVIDVDFTKKEVVITIGPNDTFILSYSEWEEFAILA